MGLTQFPSLVVIAMQAINLKLNFAHLPDAFSLHTAVSVLCEAAMDKI